MKGKYSHLLTPLFLLGITGILFFSSCKTEGCTDPKAKNFSYEANKDDGSCDYGGCTDRDALNFDPYAQYNDGTCKYLGGVNFITTRNSIASGGRVLSVHVNGQYIGLLQRTCTTQFPTCETNCAKLPFTQQQEGGYTYQFWELLPTSSTTFDTIYSSAIHTFQVTGKQCNIITIE